ncbi:MAG: flagellar motor protein MotA [Desulfococcus sp. 4484_241]|nr:MAG: flagellar motor protein MotA [Desulfococcus sp. 4484_241]
METVTGFIFRIGEYISSGGVVMIPLFGVSFVMWVLIIRRALLLRTLAGGRISRVQAGELILSNRMPDAGCRGANALLVREFLSRRVGDPSVDSFILDETVMRIVSSLNRHQRLIEVLAAAAPLLGLLGTVMGMMMTFKAITVFGAGNVRAMAGGISSALITTQTGLVIAIPGLYMSGFLARRAANLQRRVASAAIYLKRFL